MKKNGVAAFASFAVAFSFGMAAAEAATSSPGPYYAMPSWDQQLPAATRFVVLTNWNNEAVLDRETGLVWQIAPSSAVRTLDQAIFDCAIASNGKRSGWRLPTDPELRSLGDFSTGMVALPDGHPFQGVGSALYWTSTTTPTQPGTSAADSFAGELGFLDISLPLAGAWCVRGPSPGQ